MKNEDLNGVATSEVERQRALLCAYLLGELESAAERSEIEAALAASAELGARCVLGMRAPGCALRPQRRFCSVVRSC
jgi:hypothetical protein